MTVIALQDHGASR